MVLIQLNMFGNTMPRIDPRLLPESGAQTAHNCDLNSGIVAALNTLGTPASLLNSGDLRSIFNLNGHWLAWTTDVDAVSAQILNSGHRTFFTGSGYPKQTTEELAYTEGYPAPRYTRRLGVVPPKNAPVITIAGTGDGQVDDVYSYIYTYVCRWKDDAGELIQDEESAPSPPTAVGTVEGGQYIKLSNFVVPTLAATGNTITHIRVYRVVGDGAGSASYQLVGVKRSAGATTTYTDLPVSYISSTLTEIYDVNNTQDGLSDLEDAEVCPTTAWVIPPEDKTAGKYLQGLTQWQNGILAGFYDNQVCFCEPFIPYAWPVAYRYTLDYDVVAVAAHRGYLVVGTEAYPYVFEGMTPAMVQATRLSYKERCASKRGMVSTPQGVVYPSPNGLILIDGVSLLNLSAGIWSQEQWAEFDIENLIGVYKDNCYYGFFSGGNTGIIVVLSESPAARTFTLPNNVYAAFTAENDNRIQLLTHDGADYAVQEWEGGSGQLTYTWRSKQFLTGWPVSYACGRVYGDQSEANPLTINVYTGGSGTPLATLSLTNESMFRLPSGTRSAIWDFELTGTTDVRQVALGIDAGGLNHGAQ